MQSIYAKYRKSLEYLYVYIFVCMLNRKIYICTNKINLNTFTLLYSLFRQGESAYKYEWRFIQDNISRSTKSYSYYCILQIEQNVKKLILLIYFLILGFVALHFQNEYYQNNNNNNKSFKILLNRKKKQLCWFSFISLSVT